jgi:hypothetical protein
MRSGSLHAQAPMLEPTGTLTQTPCQPNSTQGKEGAAGGNANRGKRKRHRQAARVREKQACIRTSKKQIVDNLRRILLPTNKALIHAV